jgi:uncharacterized protein YdcH (DUF465 family)
MEKNLEELKAHLMETDEEYRRLAAEHAQHKKRVEDLESRPYLSEDEKLEQVKLKKLKLRLKDQMADILNRYRAQKVA